MLDALGSGARMIKLCFKPGGSVTTQMKDLNAVLDWALSGLLAED